MRPLRPSVPQSLSLSHHPHVPPGVPIIDVQLTGHPVEAKPFAGCPPGAGGECVFLGRTRPETHPEHGELVRLSYDAYRPMAIRMLERLAGSAVSRFGCLAVRIHHALGEVAPGRASVLVQVCCGHRAEAFAACRFLIDRLKAEAPIWKRQVWASGSTWSPGSPVDFEGRP